MRLIIELRAAQAVCVPVNCNELLQGAIYGLLAKSDADYARRLHDEGYFPNGEALTPRPVGTSGESPRPLSPANEGEAEDRRRFKLFVFSGLRAAARDRRVSGDLLHLAGGSRITWQVGSPVENFVTHCAMGLVNAKVLQVGGATLEVVELSAVPAPSFAETAADSGLVTAACTCLSPIVASVPATDGRTTARYLRPSDGADFAEAVRKNLIAKFHTLHGHPPKDDRLTLTFDPTFLARSAHGGTKKLAFGEIGIVGAFAPFTLAGSAEMLGLAWETGLGEKNSMGFGMVEVTGWVSAARGSRL